VVALFKIDDVADGRPVEICRYPVGVLLIALAGSIVAGMTYPLCASEMLVAPSLHEPREDAALLKSPDHDMPRLQVRATARSEKLLSVCQTGK